ncbi:MAG: secretin N-terminal domain-containing protein, partial [Planctomycetota bacterium]
IYLTRAGSRALADPRIAADLTLTDDQKKQIEELAKQSSEASAKLSSEMSEEDRTKFLKEWDDKALAILTADQRKIWDAQIAAVPQVASPNSAEPAAVADSTGTTMASDGAPPAGAEIVSSFGAASDGSDGTKLVEKFSFNFRYAPWDQVLEDFAVGAGYTLDLNQVPPGTFSHLDNKEYTAIQALDVMNGYLQRKGYALIVKDGFLVCLNVDKGLLPTLIPDVSVDDLLQVENGFHTIGNNQIVRIEIPLERLDVGVMAQEVEALLGPLGTMTAFTQTGSLIIADTGANLRRIKSYVDASIARRKGDLVFKSYALKNIDVEEAEFMLLSQFGMRQGVANVSSSSGGDRRGGPPAPTAQAQLQVLADARTNSLYVTGTPDQQALVEEILKVVDGATGPNGEPLTRTGNTGPYLKVYKVAGQADQVALSINSMMPGVVVNESGRDGTIHIYGTEKQQQQVEEWIKEFAQATGAGGSVAVIPLFKMDPLSAAATLRNLFIAEGNAAPTIETDLYGNRIIVKGTAVQVDQIKQVLKDLGEDGEKKQSEGGTIRRYSLRGRDPQEFFNYLEREWQSNEKKHIRIVVPRNSGPIRYLKTPAG